MATRLPFYPQLDGLRAAAALLIVARHLAPEAFAWEPTGGRLGADLFFVLSGFLITRSLVNGHPEELPWPAVTSFWRRRIQRIVPLFSLTLGLVALLGLESALASYKWHAFFLSNLYFVRQGGFVGTGSHLWALAVEQHFYLLWPLLLLALPASRWAAAALALIAGGIVFRVAAVLGGWPWIAIDVLTPGAFETLGIGALLALRPPSPLALALSGAGLWALTAALPPLSASWLSGIGTELHRALLLGAVVYQAVRGFPGALGRLLASSLSRWLGRVSFGVYLSHNYVFAAVKRLGFRYWPDVSLQGNAALAFIVTLLWAWACYEWIEKPLLHRQRAGDQTPATQDRSSDL